MKNLLSILLFCIMAIPVFSDDKPKTGNMRVEVYTGSVKTPISGVEVVLKDMQGKITHKRTTDDFGTCYITDLPEGLYIVIAKYKPNGGGIEVTNDVKAVIYNGITTNVHIQLSM